MVNPMPPSLAKDSRHEVLEDEAHREASRLGALTALGAEFAFELCATVEAFDGSIGGDCFVFHDCFGGEQ